MMSRIKIKDMEYKRVDLKQTCDFFLNCAERIKTATNVEEVLKIRDEINKVMNELETMMSLSYIRFSINTKDQFYLDEKDYYDENQPLMMVGLQACQKALYESKFAEELKKRINPILFQQIECGLKSFNEIIVSDLQEEAKTTTEYSKFMSELVFEFHGEKMPLAMLRKHMLSSDRAERKEAYQELGRVLGQSSETLDSIYDRLVKIRDRMAKKMGYKNYIEFGYYNMNRIFYNRQDVENFRKNVLADIVPAVTKIKNAVAKKLNLDEFKLYDNDTYFEDSPKPILDAKAMFEKGREMYHEMSDKTGDFIDMMLEADAYDYETRDGKWGGGYCTYLPKYEQPFILANFNGTSADVDVLTHETGHALNSWEGRTLEPDISYGMETAEIHSMSMEFFCWKYMDKFFGDRANDYKFSHLADALTFIPYGSIVDEFQHIVYENPEMTPAERDQAYLNLEKKYRPYLNMEGIEYLEKGTRWQYQMHIYESPFYYIDYCIAQSVALQFLGKSQENYDDAFNAYYEFLKVGGTKPLQEIIAKAGLKSPFEVGALKDISQKAVELLEKLS
ncbi:MAG: M3 family oligoendopeptidase [Clostridia bacterium]